MIISIDALFVGSPLSTAIEEFLESRFSISPADVAVIASHTHFAPSLDPAKPLLGRCNPSYLQEVIERTLGLIEHVMEAPADPVMVSRGEISCDAGVNRRRPWPWPRLAGRTVIVNQPVIHPNPDGPSAPEISVWMLTRPDGGHLAVIWRYTCHPVAFPSIFQVSSEYVGRVRLKLREEFGANLPILFLQGFAGDQFPRIRRHVSAKYWLRTPLVGPLQGASRLDEWSSWANRLAKAVCDAALNRPSARRLTGPLSSAAHQVPLSTLAHGAPADRTVEFRRLKIGEALDLVMVSAEALVGLEDLVPFEGCVPVGYLSDVFGYWPTERQRLEGGYEVTGFLAPFGLSGPLKPGLDQVFAGAMRHLNHPT
ncbi:MAG: hypothetical protein JSS04_00440 [Proteobacteria bacterium]|nr:hypothetical protein [Pseudomonadota bacterium]